MTQPQAPAQPRPGWYGDPGVPGAIRYWDGAEWSGYTLPKPPGWDQQRGATALPWWKRGWPVVAAMTTAFLLFLVVAGILSGGDEKPSQAGPDTTSTPAASAEPTPAVETKAAKPKPRKSTVPRVAGLADNQAERKLAAVGLVAFVAREVPSPRPIGTVLRQLRVAGASVREGSSVGLVLAAPYPAVPGTAGMTQANAAQRLRGAGFQVRVTQEVVTSGREGVVLRQSPVGSRLARPHSVVTLVVAHVVRPVVAPPPSNCTPGYSPCLPPASDYDCAGGSGNGPAYTGFVRVTGSDPYDLDADGDGLACES